MRVLVALCLSLAGCSKTEPVTTPREQDAPVVAESEPESKTKSPSQCMAAFGFDSDNSVLAEQRARAGAERWDDFARDYPAADIDPDAHHPVELVASFRVGDTPLLWFTPDFSGAVVNAAVLGDLKVVDATEIHPDELGRGKIRGRELAEFMLKAGVIGTYVHIGSTVCLVSETDDEQGYRARFSGRHVYYTNEENVENFGFVFEIGPEGAIAIVGAPYEEFTTLVSE